MPYLEIAGHRVWHEVSGEGTPVVLLHGGFAGASSWGANMPALLGAGELLDLNGEATQFLRAEYDAESPDGSDHFPIFHAKMLHMLNTEPELDLDTLGDVQAETLVVQGDRDEVTLEHSKAVADALPNARLAVLPGSHGLPIESPGVFNPLLISFLQSGRPTELF